MELSFVVTAVRRYWWITLICIVVGTMAGLNLRGEAVEEYSSTSLILVSAPTASAANTFSSGGDRYVQGELSVLQSTSLAESVATDVGQGLTADDVVELVEISQIISTDVINITVTTPDPALAEDIAESYVDEYFDALRAQVNDAQADDIEQLTAQLEGIERDLGAVDDDIQEVFEDVLSSVPTDPNANVFVPDLSQLRPDLETRRVILSAEYERVAIALDQLELDSRLRITSRLVQEASPAVLADTASGAMLPAAGLLAGTMIGVALAVMAAAASRKSVDARQVAEVLDRPIVAELPRARSLRTARRSMIDAVPVNVARAVEELAVLAETHARPGESFSVLVVGAERAAGSTTLAALLAGRYATHGSQTLLVDVDVRDSELTRLFAVGSPGLRGLLALDDEQPTSKRAKRIDPFTSTSIPGLSVVGIGDSPRLGSLRREAPALVEAASRHAHVVVYDGGPLLDAASTVQMAQLVDAVVLAVPMRRIYTKTLRAIGAQLGDRRAQVLPVFVPASRRRATDQGLGDPLVAVDEPQVELVERV